MFIVVQSNNKYLGELMMKKKIIVIALIMIMALLVIACSGQENLDAGTKIEESKAANYQNDNQKKLEAVGKENTEQVSGEIEDFTEELETEQDGNMTEESIFDIDLAGEWRCVSISHDGNENVFNTTKIFFLRNGEFWGIGELQEYTDYLAANIPPMKAYTNNDELYIWDSLMTALLEKGIATQKEVEQYKDMKVTYFLKDISEPSDDVYMNYVSYYKKNPNDKLTLHVTGKYQESPVTFKNIDTTYVFEKNIQFLYTMNV